MANFVVAKNPLSGNSKAAAIYRFRTISLARDRASEAECVIRRQARGNLRLEMFNILNYENLRLVCGNANSGQLCQVTHAAPAAKKSRRQVQLLMILMARESRLISGRGTRVIASRLH